LLKKNTPIGGGSGGLNVVLGGMKRKAQTVGKPSEERRGGHICKIAEP